MSLRIAILGTRGVPNHYGGFEQLAEHLGPGLVKAGHAVTVYNSHNHPWREAQWEGVSIVHCYDPEYLVGSAGQFIYDLNCIMDARKKNFDVILQLGYTSSSVWGFLFPLQTAMIYNMDGLEWQRAKYSKLTRRFLLFAEKLAVRYSNFRIADSPVIQSYYKEKYNIGTEYIAYGADIFPAADRAVLDEFGVGPGNYFLVMARMEEENNIEMILNGFCASRLDKKIVIVGNVSYKYGRYLTEKFGKDPRVVFTGAIFEKEKVHALKFFSAGYFHGHSTGGTNPSLLEAMASRALIFAHDNAFNRNVLGEDAYYFSSAADITQFVGGSVRGAREEGMTQRNYVKIVERFNWPAIIDKYERFILQSLFSFKNERNIVYRRYSRE
jgi:glycosyltransferase involved in cell wall biosynthesis